MSALMQVVEHLKRASYASMPELLRWRALDWLCSCVSEREDGRYTHTHTHTHTHIVSEREDGSARAERERHIYIYIVVE